ncbi:hypothetical protein L6452_31045 [Arctium lappa]|uniref:Uncharacterized protein n=1 Tax=Arctium lappa TaxID=4217 RepID=A0ACB8ZJQ8_ARCLA|nr:hypothetical protein L6452_31045 [Arctium lappa]
MLVQISKRADQNSDLIMVFSYAAAWDMSFQVVAAMLNKLGEFSSYFLKGSAEAAAEAKQKASAIVFMFGISRS